ncbi:hypothetical protein [Saccharothrix variisporea]|nr:hypothetical protein [Saccharothrix variisporea]
MTWCRRVAVVGLVVAAASVVVAGVRADVGARAGTGARAEVGAANVIVHLVEAISPATPFAKSVTAWCPSGMKVYSAGGALRDWSGQVVIDAVRPLPDLSGVVVSARPLSDRPAWVLVAHAVCAYGNPVLVRSNEFGALVDAKEHSVSCPVPGSLTGVTGEVVGADPDDPAALYGLVPDESLTTATAKASGPADASWTVQAYAICDKEKAGSLVREVVKIPMSGELEQEATATCAEGYAYTGGGATAYGNTGDALTVGLVWLPNPEAGSMTGVGTKGASPWGIEAYAICFKKG